MKNKDIIFLSKQSLKVHNKTTKKTKIIFIFSLVIAVVSFYFLISYNHMTKQVFNNDLFYLIRINYDDYDIYKEKKEKVFGNDFKEEMDFKNLVYPLYTDRWGNISENFYPIITLDDKEYIYKSQKGNSPNKYINLDFSNGKCFTDEEFSFLKNEKKESLILAGDSSVSGKEIIVSSDFLDAINLKYEDAINKNISLTINQRDESIKDKLEFKMFDIFQGFKIVGVYNSKIEEAYYREYSFAYLNNDDFVYINNELSYQLNYYSVVICKDYNSLNKVFDNTSVFYNNYLDEANYSLIMFSLVFEDYKGNSKYFNMIGKIFIYISVIMIIVLMLNFFISIKFHFFKNKNHFTMCKVLGFKNKELFLYYNYYIFGYLSNIFVISFFISLFISIPLTFLFNSLIDRSQFSKAFSYSLNFVFFPIAFFILVIILVFVSVVMSISIYFSNKKNNYYFR